MTRLILAVTMALTSFFASSQISGSGNIKEKKYNYKNFDKVYFEDLDGNLEVEIGKPWSVSVSIDDNLEHLLSISENPSEYELKIKFKDNENNRRYIENTNLKIKITTPEASVIINKGNSHLRVTNVTGRYFRIENSGNGTSVASGSVDILDVKKNGNGTISAEQLLAKKAEVESTGNGDVGINVSEKLTAKLSGNGNIINKGKASFDRASKKNGNGLLINR